MTKEKIQQLLASVGVQSHKDADKNIETSDYNWHLSHYFNRSELKKIDIFAQAVAHKIAANFSSLYQNKFDVEVNSITQHFASEFMTSDIKENYFLAFGSADQVFGLIDIPNQPAILWSTQLLGDTKADSNTPRKLSQLEESLLFDIASSIINAYSVSSPDELTPTGEIACGRMPVEIDMMREVCKIAFTFKQANSDQVSQACLWVFSDVIQSVAGKAAKAENIPQQNISKAMLNHFMAMPLDVTVSLSNVRFNFQQVMDIQPGDIIVLDKNVNESADLIIDNNVLLRGKPAKSNGKYSVVVTELCNRK